MLATFPGWWCDGSVLLGYGAAEASWAISIDRYDSMNAGRLTGMVTRESRRAAEWKSKRMIVSLIG